MWKRTGTALESDFGLSREPLAGVVLGQEHLGWPVTLGKVEETLGEIRRRLVGRDDGDWPPRLEVAGIGAHPGPQHHDIVVIVLGDRQTAVEQLAIGQCALEHYGVEEFFDILQPGFALGPGLDEALVVIDREMNWHVPAITTMTAR